MNPLLNILAICSFAALAVVGIGGLILERRYSRRDYLPAEISIYCPNPELVLFTQWQLEAEAPVLYEKCADELECWCAQVDLYQWNESAELYQLSEQWSEAHEHRLRASLGEEV